MKLEWSRLPTSRRCVPIPTGKMLLVNFWATWCGSCVHEFPDFEETYRMYSVRDLELVTVSANMPDEKNGVMKLLEKMHATSRNLLFASDDTAALQAAFDPKWESAVPYTVLLAPGGKVLYQKQGSVDMLELRRTILANLPSDYVGFNKYWSDAVMAASGLRKRPASVVQLEPKLHHAVRGCSMPTAFRPSS